EEAAAKGRAEPDGRRRRPRRPDPLAGLQGGEGLDRFRRDPRRAGDARREIIAHGDATRSSRQVVIAISWGNDSRPDDAGNPEQAAFDRRLRLAGGPKPTMIVLPETRSGAPGLKLPSAPRMVWPSAYVEASRLRQTVAKVASGWPSRACRHAPD